MYFGDRVLVVCSLLTLLGSGCGDDRPALSEESGSETAGDSDPDVGDESADTDDDVPLLEPCSWVPVSPVECDVAFGPTPPEPPAPAWTYKGILPQFDIIAHADAVEVLWIRYYFDINTDPIEARRYIASNAEGAWQHQFLRSDPCELDSCSPDSPPRIGGSWDRTQITPPYMRREGGQWQAPVIDAQTDPLVAMVYDAPEYFAVAPDDRSYFVTTSVEQQQFMTWLWAESDLGCHAPTWRLEPGDCPPSSVAALAVDPAGFLHMTGGAQAGEGDWRIVHWLVLPDSIEGHELERLPAGSFPSYHDLAIGESGEIHLCHWELDGRVGVYGHGHDASDWTTIEIEDPDADGPNAPEPGWCQLALATDGTVWLTWAAGEFVPTDPFRVASVVDDVISYEIIDVGANEAYAGLTVDPLGRPWIAYAPSEPYNNTIKVAHKDSGQWIIEEIATP